MQTALPRTAEDVRRENAKRRFNKRYPKLIDDDESFKGHEEEFDLDALDLDALDKLATTLLRALRARSTPSGPNMDDVARSNPFVDPNRFIQALPIEVPATTEVATQKVLVSNIASSATCAGKQFAALYCLWADARQLFDGEAEEMDPVALAPTDAATRSAWSKAGLHDLKLKLPDVFKAGWDTEQFRADFVKGMNTCRTDIKDIVNSPLALFEITDLGAWTKSQQRRDIPAIKDLLENTLFAHPPGLNPVNTLLRRSFRHPSLEKILRVVLYGPASLTNTAGSRFTKANNTRESKWRPVKITYRGIAMAATMARIVLLQNSLDCAESKDYYWKCINKLLLLPAAVRNKLEEDINDSLGLNPPKEDVAVEDSEVDRAFADALVAYDQDATGPSIS